jgi:S-DNA-T family DNA segregation ATPase FtsK/SpoIIIE
MRFVFVGTGGARDLEAHFEPPQPTIGDLISGLTASGLTHGGEPGLFVNGMFQAAAMDLMGAGLHNGALVSAGDAGAAIVPAASTFIPGPHLGVLTGMAAGRSFPLTTAGVYLVGRSADCHLRLPDPTVSRVHCELHVGDTGAVTVVNRSRADGTRIAGEPITQPAPVPPGRPIRLGAVVVQIDHANLTDRAATDRMASPGGPEGMAPTGTVNFNRPPRVVHFPPTTTLVPLEEPEAPLKARFTWRRSAREFDRQVAALVATINAARSAEMAARRRPMPTAPEVVRRACLPSAALWERRRFHSDFLHLCLGWWDAPWTPTLALPSSIRPPAAAVRESVAGKQVLADVPVVLDLSASHVVGVVGPRPLALGVARQLACQAAVLHGPADVRLCVLAPDSTDSAWDWIKWLPHVHDRSTGSERRLLAASDAAVSDLLGWLRAAAPAPAPDRPADDRAVTLYVVDGDGLLSGRSAPARQLLNGAAGPAAGIVLAPAADRLPAVCSEIVTLIETGEAHLVHSRQGGAASLIRPAALAVDLARSVALSLAGLDDPEQSPPGAAGPDKAGDRPGTYVVPFHFGATARAAEQAVRSGPGPSLGQP